MSELNTQTQIIELNDDQLELVEGGRSQTANTVVDFISFVIPVNRLSGVRGGPTFGDLL